MSGECIPDEVRIERYKICQECKVRKWMAKKFDFHFDWIDCPYDCLNDYEHWAKEGAE